MDAIMEIKKIPITEINPASYNPRKDLQPGNKEYEKLQKSIEEFGYVEPLVWNKSTGTLISGHQRLKILKAQGVKEVEVSVVDLSAEKEKVLNIALNKIEGRWDEKKLSGILFELTKMPDFEFELTGFELPELSQLLDRYQEIKDGDDYDFDAAINALGEIITKRGDIIELGWHRILCGDSSNKDDIKRLMANEAADLLYTDPPYNVNYYGGHRPHTKARPKKCKHWVKVYQDNLSDQEYRDKLKSVLVNICEFLSPNAVSYIWNAHKNFGLMHDILIDLNFHVASVIVWAKPNFSISFADYSEQVEFCLYSWRCGNGAHPWYGKNETTLWQIKRDPPTSLIHPTQKPVALASRALANSSKRGDFVADLYLGSGSTLISAESLGRRCFGMEIDPKFCDAIVRRYIAYVGKNKVSRDIVKRYLKED
ncbi:MAG: DNA methyltransferase [Candidatus Zapsychrus exili]|nr:DNA methyltransferase [Candidatus Zapsychrus exili]